MPDNYTLQATVITDDVDVRLVGIITEEECEAIINSNDGHIPRKISTAQSIRFDDYVGAYHKCNRRFVLVLRNKSKRFENNTPAIYISPIINNAIYTGNGWTVYCIPKENVPSNLFRFKEKSVKVKEMDGVSTENEKDNSGTDCSHRQI